MIPLTWVKPAVQILSQLLPRWRRVRFLERLLAPSDQGEPNPLTWADIANIERQREAASRPESEINARQFRSKMDTLPGLPSNMRPATPPPAPSRPLEPLRIPPMTRPGFRVPRPSSRYDA